MTRTRRDDIFVIWRSGIMCMFEDDRSLRWIHTVGMPYIGRKVALAEGKSVGVGRFEGQCAALVQWFGGAPKTFMWKQGVRVKGNGDAIEPYTCIATFENGVYPNRKHGNHAAIYLSQDEYGIQVYDQWVGKPIGKRTLRFYENESDEDPSNNGNCFYVIE